MGYGEQDSPDIYGMDPDYLKMAKGLQQPEAQAPSSGDLVSGAGQGAAAGAMAGGLPGAAIGAGAGLAASLAKQANDRQMMKIQNELLRRKNLQASIEQGSTGIEQAQNQKLQNLARAFLR